MQENACLVHPEEKVKKRNETVKILSKGAPRKPNMQFFSERDLLPIQAMARGAISWKMVKSPTGLPNQGEKLVLQRPGNTRLLNQVRTMFHPKVSSNSRKPVKYRYVTSKRELNLSKSKVVFEQFIGLSFIEADHLPMAGRLQFFVKNWQVVTNDPWVLSAISGYHIPFTIIPHQDFLPSHKVSVEDELLIDKELGEPIQKRAIHLVSKHDYNTGVVSNLFVIPKKGGGQRPVFKLRQLNQFIKYERFKMEGIHMLRDLLKPNDFMAKIDLKDAYFTVAIWEGHQKFLRFLWNGTQWEFACLQFGIATAPRVFTKILKPVIGLLRKQGIRLIIYLDDFLLMASTEETLLYHVPLTVTLLEMLGFVVNYQKSQLNPTQSIEFLGFHINSIMLIISLPLDNVKGIRKECQKLLENPYITITELARLLGKLSASIQAVFPAPLHYRHIQAVKKRSLAPHGAYESQCTGLQKH